MIKLPQRYEKIIEKLPGGGMSEAIVCNDSHLDRYVVIKSLKAGVDPKRLLDELSALSAIRSKHVVQVYDVIRTSTGQVIGFVEEYLSGEGVSEVAAPKDSNDAIALLYQIACGIADIHAHGRVHRDIKPDNMRRDANGCLKIFDFGLAKLEGGGTAELFFTPGFVAPEAFGQNAAGHYIYSEELDTFAFGATALSLLSGGKLPKELLVIPPHVDPKLVDFANVPQALPAPVAEALSSCMDADPKRRPKMVAVRDVLGRHLLFDRHRAKMVYDGKESELNLGRRRVNFRFGKDVSLWISYDGFGFSVTEVAGPVYINNMSVSVGFALPGACIIVMGDASLGRRRGMIAFSISHPEVTL